MKTDDFSVEALYEILMLLPPHYNPISPGKEIEKNKSDRERGKGEGEGIGRWSGGGGVEQNL